MYTFKLKMRMFVCDYLCHHTLNIPTIAINIDVVKTKHKIYNLHAYNITINYLKKTINK